MRRAFFLTTAIALLPVAITAQTPDAKPLPFEVASVKLNTDLSNTNLSINFAPGGQLNCSNVPLRMLITFAYDMRDYQVVNAPGWADTDHFDIVAKPSAEDAVHEPSHYTDASTERLRLRTRALLAERFGLKLREEKREMPVYSLVVAKGGPKLQPTTSNTADTQMTMNNTRLICRKVTMERFATHMLSSRMGRPVIDNTGLTGEYDFKMEFQPEPRASAPSADAAPAPSGPSFLTALEEQLGLRLVSAKGPVPFLIVEHVEKPSAN